MSTTYLMEDPETGAQVLKQTTNELPAYEIGQMIIYKKDHTDTIEIEAQIIGITQDTFINVHDFITHQIVYDLDNGEQVFEDDIIKFYEVEGE